MVGSIVRLVGFLRLDPSRMVGSIVLFVRFIGPNASRMVDLT